MNASVRVAIVTNIPAPYRVPIFNLLAKNPAICLTVAYCAERESDRAWDLPEITHSHLFLKGSVFQRRNGRFFHNNPGVFGALRVFDPDVVITTGFNPTHLYAFVFAKLKRRRHIVMTDGTPASEAHLSWLHRTLRRIIVGGSDCFIVASKAGHALLEGYGARPHSIHVSPLCANALVQWPGQEVAARDFDLIFSGRLVDVKNPFFALEVARETARRLARRMRLVMLGEGPLEAALRQRAAEMATDIHVEFCGNVTQVQVPHWFGRARIFLFPTLWDPWGVVANEACLAGLPCIASPHAGASGELIQHAVNGYVLPLDSQRWAAACCELLSNSLLYQQFSTQARIKVRPYSCDNAARGIGDAVRGAFGQAAT